MKAPAFEYVRATSLEEVLELLDRHGDDAKLIAGGQSLIPTLNMRLSAPTVLVDINSVSELTGLSVANGCLRVGALTRHYQLVGSPEIAANAPLISQAAPHIAHEAVRSRGSFGGSIAHADPAAELPACALALRARFDIASRSGTRTVAADDFFQGLYETALEPGDVLLSANVPVKEGYRSGFMELCRRRGDYAMVGLAAHGKIDGGVFSDVRLVFFSIADRPVLAASAGAALEGRTHTPEAVRLAQDALEDDVEPMGDLYNSSAMKAHLARVLVSRVLAEMAGQ